MVFLAASIKELATFDSDVAADLVLQLAKFLHLFKCYLISTVLVLLVKLRPSTDERSFAILVQSEQEACFILH